MDRSGTRAVKRSERAASRRKAEAVRAARRSKKSTHRTGESD